MDERGGELLLLTLAEQHRRGAVSIPLRDQEMAQEMEASSGV